MEGPSSLGANDSDQDDSSFVALLVCEGVAFPSG